jgi:hypothetical protein
VAHHNRDGYRTAAESSGGKGEVRVLFVGDSQTYGYFVSDEDRFPELLQARGQGIGLPVAAVTLAMPGDSLHHYFEQLFVGTKRYSASSAVVLLYSGNDLLRLAAFEEPVAEIPELRTSSASLAWRVVKRRLRRFYLYHLARAGFDRVRALAAASPGAGSSKPGSGELQLSGAYYQSLAQAEFFLKHPNEFERSFGTYVMIFRQIVNLAHEKGCPIVVFVLPSKLLVEEERAKVFGLKQADALGITLESAHQLESATYQRMVTISNKEGVPTLGLLDSLRSAAREKELF